MGEVARPGSRGEIQLLWTGGWDSTFRLLWLTCVERRDVQPYYVAEAGRASTRAELAAMAAIREQLRASDAAAAERIRPLIVQPGDEVKQHEIIRASFERLLTRAFIGSQYQWLADFCRQFELTGLELAIHRDDKAHALLERIVGPGTPDDRRPAVPLSLRGGDEYVVFGAFRFPVFHLAKVDMQRLAQEYGFDQLMELTWFCHAPRANGTPCGRCSPCVYTMEEGMSRRLPWSSRLRYHLRVVARIRHWFMRHPSLHQELRRLRQRAGA